MNKQTVLIADIVESREIENRYEIQKQLVSLIDKLNSSFQQGLIKKVEISSGDSFQGLFKTCGWAFLYFRSIQFHLVEIRFRAGFGQGELSYMDESFTSNQLDGEAFHRAREALELAQDVSIVLIGERDTKLLNLMLEMYQKHLGSFSNSAWKVALLNEQLHPMSFDGSVFYTSESEPLVLDELKEQKILFDSSDYVKRGIQKEIGERTGTSRQNVNRYFVSGLMDERKYAAEIAQFLHRGEWL